MSLHHSGFLSRAFELAASASGKGNHPFGALLVLDSKIILEAENTVLEESDPTRHAELCLVSKASRLFTANELARATLYSSTEPCAMCSGAIYWAGIRQLVFGCSAKRLGEIAGGAFVTDCRDILRFAKERVSIEGPLFEDEAARVHHRYWKQI